MKRSAIMTTSENWLQIGRYEFVVESASFRYIIESWSGPGWDFTFVGRCTNDDGETSVFPYGAKLYTEASPLPLEPADDFTGIEIVLDSPYDEESGEPYFGLKLWEEHDVSRMRLHFVKKDGDRYLIEITATIADSVFGHEEQLNLRAWVKQLPDHAYPT